MSCPLLCNYNTNLHHRIKLLERLRDLGFNNNVTIPKLAFIGIQGCGKSTVISALTGICLPCGEKERMTRCPVELHLNHLPEGADWHAKLTYCIGDETRVVECSTAADISLEIIKAQDKLAKFETDVCNEPIILNVQSDAVPELILIDTPGIRPTDKKDDAACLHDNSLDHDAPDVAKAIARKYIQDENTFIIVIISASEDIATSSALQMADNVDIAGFRTIGVLTKPDLVDQNYRQEFVEALSNKTAYLPNGYFSVLCKMSCKSVSYCLEDILEYEENYFSDATYLWESYDSDVCGIRHLAQKILEEILKQIDKKLLLVGANIKEKSKEIYKNLEKFGETNLAEKADYCSPVIRVALSFADEVKCLMNMKPSSHENNKCTLKEIASLFNKLTENISNINTEFVQNFDTAMSDGSFDNHFLLHPTLNGSFVDCDVLKMKIARVISQYDAPVMDALNGMLCIIKQSYETNRKSYFGVYPELNHAVEILINKLIKKANNAAEQRLQQHLKTEQLIFWNSPQLISQLIVIQNKSQVLFSNPNANNLFLLDKNDLHKTNLHKDASLNTTTSLLQSLSGVPVAPVTATSHGLFRPTLATTNSHGLFRPTLATTNSFALSAQSTKTKVCNPALMCSFESVPCSTSASNYPLCGKFFGPFGDVITTAVSFGKPLASVPSFSTTHGLIGSPLINTSSHSLFGSSSNISTTSHDLFGSSSISTSGHDIFGSSSISTTSHGLFGSTTINTSYGTFAGSKSYSDNPSFIPPSGSDTVVKNNLTSNVQTRHQCITAMKEYESLSLEELRIKQNTPSYIGMPVFSQVSASCTASQRNLNFPLLSSPTAIYSSALSTDQNVQFSSTTDSIFTFDKKSNTTNLNLTASSSSILPQLFTFSDRNIAHARSRRSIRKDTTMKTTMINKTMVTTTVTANSSQKQQNAGDVNKKLQKLSEYFSCYLDFVQKRICDVIPMLLLDELVHELGDQIRTEVLSLTANLPEFHEDKETTKKRERLKLRAEQIQDVLNELDIL